MSYLHQADKLLIGPLTTPIMADLKINEAQMGAVSSFAVIVASVLYPVWGYLYDHYLRSRLLALASLIWGITTTLNALARSYGVFLVTRGSTGIDDSSYPGIYSLLSDYYPPRKRSTAYGILVDGHAVGVHGGAAADQLLKGALGWRGVYSDNRRPGRRAGWGDSGRCARSGARAAQNRRWSGWPKCRDALFVGRRAGAF